MKYITKPSFCHTCMYDLFFDGVDMIKSFFCLIVFILMNSNLCKAIPQTEASETAKTTAVFKEALKEVLEKKLSSEELDLVMHEVEEAKHRIEQEKNSNTDGWAFCFRVLSTFVIIFSIVWIIADQQKCTIEKEQLQRNLIQQIQQQDHLMQEQRDIIRQQVNLLQQQVQLQNRHIETLEDLVRGEQNLLQRIVPQRAA